MTPDQSIVRQDPKNIFEFFLKKKTYISTQTENTLSEVACISIFAFASTDFLFFLILSYHSLGCLATKNKCLHV